MRLIDADAPDLGHCKGGEVCGVVFVRLNDVALAIKNTPTIDPIHAAGGCYCWECTKFRRYTKNNITFGICKRHNSEVRENDFCSYNDGKDGGNVEEFAALKEKEAGTDVHQQDD